MPRLRWILLVLSVVLACGVLLVAWLLGSESGFRWLAGRVDQFAGSRLEIRAVSGSLASPLRIGRLSIRTASQHFQFDDLALDWQPSALLRWHLQIDRLGARRLFIESIGTPEKEAGAPLMLPTSLRLPLALKINQLYLDSLQTGLNQPALLQGLRASVDATQSPYRLELGLRTEWASLQGKASLEPDAPFRLDAALAVQRADQPALDAELKLNGPLEQLLLKVRARSGEARLLADGRLAPFAELPLQALKLQARQIDPRAFAASAPQASLDLDADLTQEAANAVRARIGLKNRIPGRIDQERLPLEALSAGLLATPTSASIENLRLDLGAAGSFSGTLQWLDQHLRLDLQGPGLNLAGLHKALYPTRIATRLTLEGDQQTRNLALELSEARGRAKLLLNQTGERLTLQSLDASGTPGRLNGKGSLTLDESRLFAVQLSLDGLNPAALGKFPKASLNARLQASGSLTPEPRLQAELRLPSGHLEGRPVEGEAYLRYDAGRLHALQARLMLAGNFATLAGAYGDDKDTLQWKIDAPALARLYPALAGQLRSHGQNHGLIGRGSLEAELSARALALPGEIRIPELDLALALDTRARGRFSGSLHARAPSLQGQKLESLDLQLSGRRDAHELTLQARDATQSLLLQLAGGLDAKPRWQGEIRQLVLTGPHSLRLLAPASLRADATEQRLAGFRLQGAGGELNLSELQHRAAGIRSSGTLRELSLAEILTPLKLDLPFSTDLRLDGDWNFDYDARHDSLLGNLQLKRRSGDLRLRSPAQQLGLETLELRLDSTQAKAQGRLRLATSRGARIDADASALIERGLSQLDAQTALRWQLDARLPDLTMTRAFLPPGISLDGAVEARLTGEGSLAAPKLDGTASLRSIRFRYPQEGVAITDGELRLRFSENRLQVEQGELKGQQGRILLSGGMALQDYRSDLELVFEQFEATRRADRQVQLSGKTRLQFDSTGLALTGTLKVDRARLEMPEASPPSLSDDVIVVRKDALASRQAGKSQALRLDLRIELGDRTYFKGAGLDARLGGALRVFSDPRGLRGEGAIQVEEGRFSAYATTLVIKRGILRFNGPIDNPALDILAVRSFSELTVGVTVGGNVQRPLVSLYSDPDMQDSEKLAWLVLGHGLDGSGQQEFALMQLAASGLLAQGESVNLQASIAETLGIDSISLRAGDGEDLGTAVGSVGKRLSARATLSYEQSLDGLNQAVKLIYQLTRHIRLETQAGQRSSLDAIYTIDYD